MDSLLADRLGEIAGAVQTACLWLAIRDTASQPSVRDIAQANLLAAVARMNAALCEINEAI